MSVVYRVYRINHDIEGINAAFDYRRKTSSEDKDPTTNEYYDSIWEHEVKEKVYELNQNQMQRQLSRFPEVEFWYRAIENE